MSTPTQEILYNISGQTIYLDATEGRPSSITSVSVYSDSTGDDGTAETYQPGDGPSVESAPNTTVDAASGAAQTDPRKIKLAATTGIAVGRTYLITGSSGEKEWVEVTEIVSGDYVIVRSPLHNDYVSSNTFQTTRMSVGFLDSWIQDTSNITDDLNPAPGYRVRWVYVVNSETFVKDTYFDVVRYKGTYNVTPADMERFMPSWRNILPTYFRGDNGRGLIKEAYTQVKMDLYGIDRADEMIRDREALDELVKNKARELLLFHRFFETSVGGEVADESRKMYQYRLDSLIAKTTKIPFAADTGGSSERITSIGIWSK